MDKREVKKIGWAALLTAIIILSLNGERWYWKYWPMTPAIVYGIKVTNPGKTVCPGQPMTYEVDIDRKLKGPVTIKRQLVNSAVITLPSSEPPEKPLGRQIVPAQVPTSRAADYGEWFMRWTAEYELGPEKNRTETISMNSDKYHVVSCEGAK
jgi:hypothetical protein